MLKRRHNHQEYLVSCMQLLVHSLGLLIWWCRTRKCSKWYWKFSQYVGIIHCTFKVTFKYAIPSNAKVVCRIEKLLELVGEIYQHDGCSAKQVVKYNIIGCCIVIRGLCEHGHCFTWESSDNLQFASALVLSGNNYHKFAIFTKFFGQQIIGQTTFHMYQQNLICPGIDSYYQSEQVSWVL